MSTSLKIIFGVIIILLLGATAYLGYTYFTESKKLGLPASQTLSNPSQTPQPVKIDRSQAKEYQGEIFCIKDTEKGASLASCESFGILMSDDKTYELVLESGVTASEFTEMQKVKVLGVISDKTSPFGLPGSINVFKISGQ